MADDISAFLVRRNDEGKVLPYEVQVLGVRDTPLIIEILPTTVGSLKGLKDPNSDAVKWTVEDKLRYVREHVVNPDFSAMSEDELMEQMTQWDLDMILITAIQNGGPMRQKKAAIKEDPTRRSGPSKKKSRRSKPISMS